MQRLLPVEYFKDHREFEQQLIACETCGELRPFRDMNSLACVYRMPGLVDHGSRQERKASYQCPDIQHFGCCHEHAMLALLQCMFFHIHEGPHNDQGKEIEHETLLKIRGLIGELITEEKTSGLLKEGNAETPEEEPKPEERARRQRKKARNSEWQS